MAGAGPGPGGGGAEPTRRGGQHREPEDQPAGLRPAVRRRALRWPAVEGHQRGPDPDREPHRGGVRGADPDGEGAAGGRGGLHTDRKASAGEGAGPGRGHRHREDRVLAQSPHEVLEETPVPAQEDDHPAADGAADQQHRAGPQTDMMKMMRRMMMKMMRQTEDLLSGCKQTSEDGQLTVTAVNKSIFLQMADS